MTCLKSVKELSTVADIGLSESVFVLEIPLSHYFSYEDHLYEDHYYENPYHYLERCEARERAIKAALQEIVQEVRIHGMNGFAYIPYCEYWSDDNKEDFYRTLVEYGYVRMDTEVADRCGEWARCTECGDYYSTVGILDIASDLIYKSTNLFGSYSEWIINGSLEEFLGEHYEELPETLHINEEAVRALLKEKAKPSQLEILRAAFL